MDSLDLVEEYVRQVCNDSVTPPLTAKILRIELPDAEGNPRPVLKIEVPRSLYVHESRGGYFQRLGSSRRKLTPNLLARLFQQRGLG